MFKVIFIKDWDKHFENSESRKVKSLRWVGVPNKHDGAGYRRLVAHPKSERVFCAWSLIIQVASKMPSRGVLVGDDGPLTASDLAFKTGFSEQLFEVAIPILAEPKIGWVEIREIEDWRILLPSPPGSFRGHPDASGQSSVVGEGMGNDSLSQIPARARLEPPTLEQCKEFGAQNDIKAPVVFEFFHHYNGKGWLDGNNAPVHDWRSKLIIWNLNNARNKSTHGPRSDTRKSRVDRNIGTTNKASDYDNIPGL